MGELGGGEGMLSPEVVRSSKIPVLLLMGHVVPPGKVQDHTYRLTFVRISEHKISSPSKFKVLGLIIRGWSPHLKVSPVVGLL